MNITDVRVYHNENSKILANASITFEGKVIWVCTRCKKIIMKQVSSMIRRDKK